MRRIGNPLDMTAPAERAPTGCHATAARTTCVGGRATPKLARTAAMLGRSDGSPRTCTAGGERINPYGPEGHAPTGIEEEVVNRRRCHRGSLALSPDPL